LDDLARAAIACGSPFSQLLIFQMKYPFPWSAMMISFVTAVNLRQFIAHYLGSLQDLDSIRHFVGMEAI
jgi:hypothetical protein